jgi:hypothetical protein
MIGDRFQLVTPAKEGAVFGAESIVSDYAYKFAAHAAMRFERSLGMLEAQGLRGMKSSLIGRVRRRLVQLNADHGRAFGQYSMRAIEMELRLRPQSSVPSRRISRKIGVCFAYAQSA